MDKFDYIGFLNCSSEDEVKKAITAWSSNSTNEDKFIRVAILDLHAQVERVLKKVLYETLVDIMPLYDDDQDEQNLNELQKVIKKQNFFNTLTLLKPSLKAFGSPEFDYLHPINDCRNQVAHGDIENVKYFNRNPFEDADSLAHFFTDCWGVKQSLTKFIDRMILDPRAKCKNYEKEYLESIGIKIMDDK